MLVIRWYDQFASSGNKGYTSANFLASFAPDYGLTPMNTFQKIEEFARLAWLTYTLQMGHGLYYLYWWGILIIYIYIND